MTIFNVYLFFGGFEVDQINLYFNVDEDDE